MESGDSIESDDGIVRLRYLANKWSMEESETRNKLVSDLQVIFDK